MTLFEFEAMKPLITKNTDNRSYLQMFPDTSKDAIVYRFSASKLDYSNEEYGLDDIVMGMTTHNIWNVAERFFSLCSRFDSKFSQRLLQKA